jgi:hypothetical protein
MLDIKNVEPDVLFFRDMTTDVFFSAMNTIGETVYFQEGEEFIKNFLLKVGFTDISSSSQMIHYMVINSTILIIHIDYVNIDDRYIKDKFWLRLTDENLKYIENYNKSEDKLLESLFFVNNKWNQLYNISLEAPFNERFFIRKTQELFNVGLSFQYEENKVMTAKIFHRKGGFVHINYLHPEERDDSFFSDFIEFIEGNIKVARLLNLNRKIELDITPDSDILDVASITLDNFHLFWNHFTPEQKLLVEMSAI